MNVPPNKPSSCGVSTIDLRAALNGQESDGGLEVHKTALRGRREHARHRAARAHEGWRCGHGRSTGCVAGARLIGKSKTPDELVKLVFPFGPSQAADAFRADLKRGGAERLELFDRSAMRRPSAFTICARRAAAVKRV